MLIVVAFVVAKIVGFLVITRYHEVGSGRNYLETLPIDLPDVSKPFKTFKNLRRTNI